MVAVVRPLSKAVLWVADFDGAPVAGSYQADEAQQVSKSPGHIGGVVATGKTPGAHLVAQKSNRKSQQLTEQITNAWEMVYFKPKFVNSPKHIQLVNKFK